MFAHLFIDPIKAPENVFKAVAEYKIVGGTDIPRGTVPFPACSDLSFGPDPILSEYGLRPRTTDAVIKVPKGFAQLVFDKDQPDIRVYARLVKDGVPDNDLKMALNLISDANTVCLCLLYSSVIF